MTLVTFHGLLLTLNPFLDKRLEGLYIQSGSLKHHRAILKEIASSHCKQADNWTEYTKQVVSDTGE